MFRTNGFGVAAKSAPLDCSMSRYSQLEKLIVPDESLFFRSVNRDERWAVGRFVKLVSWVQHHGVRRAKNQVRRRSGREKDLR
jgi:hypothetical protein